MQRGARRREVSRLLVKPVVPSMRPLCGYPSRVNNPGVDTSEVLNYRRFSDLELVRFALEIFGIIPVVIIGFAR